MPKNAQPIHKDIWYKNMSRLLFITSESLYTTSDELILKITNPIEEKFNDMYTKKYADEELKSIGIIFICLTQQMMDECVLKERNYISRKNKYADMRLWVNSIEIRKANEATRKQIVWDTIAKALNNIREKKAFNRIDEFEEDLRQIYWSDQFC